MSVPPGNLNKAQFSQLVDMHDDLADRSAEHTRKMRDPENQQWLDEEMGRRHAGERLSQDMQQEMANIRKMLGVHATDPATGRLVLSKRDQAWLKATRQALAQHASELGH